MRHSMTHPYLRDLAARRRHAFSHGRAGLAAPHSNAAYSSLLLQDRKRNEVQRHRIMSYAKATADLQLADEARLAAEEAERRGREVLAPLVSAARDAAAAHSAAHRAPVQGAARDAP